MLSGVVTDGWLKGSPLTGEFTAFPRPQSANGTCFAVKLHIAWAHNC